MVKLICIPIHNLHYTVVCQHRIISHPHPLHHPHNRLKGIVKKLSSTSSSVLGLSTSSSSSSTFHYHFYQPQSISRPSSYIWALLQKFIEFVHFFSAVRQEGHVVVWNTIILFSKLKWQKCVENHHVKRKERDLSLYCNF